MSTDAPGTAVARPSTTGLLAPEVPAWRQPLAGGDAPSAPVRVVSQVLDGLEDGSDEVLADELARTVRTAVHQDATMSGLELLRAVADGILPPAPLSRHCDFPPSVEEGDVVSSGTPDESAYHPIGMVHGGFVCTLLDTVTGCAVHTTSPAGTACTSIEVKVSHLRPVHQAGRAPRRTAPGQCARSALA